jgi:murein DD-endopeptidase MepM/ murein hydrolase activator NlpD
MGKGIDRNRGLAAVPTVVAILGLLAACAPAARGPAPLVNGGGAGPAPGPAWSAGPPPATVVVQPGQSLSMIARTYHLSWPALAAANHLSPPYRIEPGQRLVLPAPGGYAGPPPVAVAALPPPVALTPPAPERPRTIATEPMPQRPRAIAAKPLPPRARASAPPRVIPLDRPHAVASATAPPASRSFDRPIPLDNPLAGARPPATREAAAGHGDFIWPVRGPVIEGFGAGPDGTRNEGINIAAPRGAPIRAADGGVVAYVGNELRGYGNLILIKHPQGWISAYAHCGAVLVRRGEKVRRGQIIARVGATGNVTEPQLHFELRRGQKAVDPRPLLGAPAAADAGRARTG